MRKAGGNLLRIYRMGILDDKACSKGAYGRHILGNLLALIKSCPWMIEGILFQF